MLWLRTEGTGQGSASSPCSGSMPYASPAVDTTPFTSLRGPSIARQIFCPADITAHGGWRGVARMIPIYTLYERLQKTRIPPQGRLRGGLWRRELSRTGSVLLTIAAAHGDMR